MMNLGMFGARHDLKIRRGVVLPVLVFVMDAFVFLQLSAKHLFGNDNVLLHIARAYKNAHVAFVIDASASIPKVMVRSFASAKINAVSVLVGYLARLAAIAGVSARDLARPRKEPCSADETGSRNIPVFRASRLGRIRFSHVMTPASCGLVRSPMTLVASRASFILAPGAVFEREE